MESIVKKKNIKYFCVLDDGKARKVADERDLNFTGLDGLIEYLFHKKAISEEEFTEINNLLEKSRFRTRKKRKLLIKTNMKC